MSLVHSSAGGRGTDATEVHGPWLRACRAGEQVSPSWVRLAVELFALLFPGVRQAACDVRDAQIGGNGVC
jgi:hypothetical protein